MATISIRCTSASFLRISFSASSCQGIFYSQGEVCAGPWITVIELGKIRTCNSARELYRISDTAPHKNHPCPSLLVPSFYEPHPVLAWRKNAVMLFRKGTCPLVTMATKPKSIQITSCLSYLFHISSFKFPISDSHTLFCKAFIAKFRQLGSHLEDMTLCVFHLSPKLRGQSQVASQPLLPVWSVVYTCSSQSLPFKMVNGWPKPPNPPVLFQHYLLQSPPLLVSCSRRSQNVPSTIQFSHL